MYRVHFWVLSFALIAIWLLGCQRSESENFVELPYTTLEPKDAIGLDSESMWRSKVPTIVAIDSKADIHAVQRGFEFSSDSLKLLNTIDYRNQYVVGVFQGVQANIVAGTPIVVNHIYYDQNNVIYVDVIFREPQEGEGVLSMVASPYILIVVEKPDPTPQNIEFILRANSQNVASFSP